MMREEGLSEDEIDQQMGFGLAYLQLYQLFLFLLFDIMKK